jgi:hypothetical protein
VHHPVLLETDEILAAVSHALDKVAWHVLDHFSPSHGA